MPKYYNEERLMRGKKSKKLPVILTVAAVVVILVVTIVVAIKIGGGDRSGGTKQSKAGASSVDTQLSDEETEPTEVVPVSSVRIGSAGDILIHRPILNGAYSNGNYDFNDIFTYVSGTIKQFDYFIANLEVTLGGSERGYSSYPCFNTPDAIVDAAKKAGIDCLLTANNHCYDSSESGLLRTLKVLNEKKIDHTGTRLTESDKKYFIKDVKGIKFGFICYTYETAADGYKAINGIATSSTAAPLINSFDYGNLDAFYSDVSAQLDKMRAEGADVLIVYPHWGEEYELSANSFQKEMAQKLCNMGVDVIIGGHPHVVQPVDLLTSEKDSSHKTACLYSMGNFVSNQRRQYMGLNDGHTEDGLIFELDFTKYSDGSVSFDKGKIIPTWVHMYGNKPVFAITPVASSNISEDAEKLGLNNSSSGLSLAKGSYDRTAALVSEGIKKVNAYLKKGVTLGENGKSPVETTAALTETSAGLDDAA